MGIVLNFLMIPIIYFIGYVLQTKLGVTHPSIYVALGYLGGELSAKLWNLN